MLKNRRLTLFPLRADKLAFQFFPVVAWGPVTVLQRLLFIAFTSVSLSNVMPTEQCLNAAGTKTDNKLLNANVFYFSMEKAG